MSDKHCLMIYIYCYACAELLTRIVFYPNAIALTHRINGMITVSQLSAFEILNL